MTFIKISATFVNTSGKGHSLDRGFLSKLLACGCTESFRCLLARNSGWNYKLQFFAKRRLNLDILDFFSPNLVQSLFNVFVPSFPHFPAPSTLLYISVQKQQLIPKRVLSHNCFFIDSNYQWHLASWKVNTCWQSTGNVS